MKEELKANLLTKYACGLCSPEEEAFVIAWLESNVAHNYFLEFIKKNLQKEEKTTPILA